MHTYSTMLEVRQSGNRKFRAEGSQNIDIEWSMERVHWRTNESKGGGTRWEAASVMTIEDGLRNWLRNAIVTGIVTSVTGMVLHAQFATNKNVTPINLRILSK